VIVIKTELCDRCLECLAVCPDFVLSYKEDKVTVTDKCCECLACIYVCIRNAIEVIE